MGMCSYCSMSYKGTIENVFLAQYGEKVRQKKKKKMNCLCDLNI